MWLIEYVHEFTTLLPTTPRGGELVRSVQEW